MTNPTPIRASARADQDALLAVAERAFKEDLPEITEDSMPGELSNVIAGRIANAFDLGGANYTVDAACASSMAALQSAVKGLQDGDWDIAITGGADRSMNLPTYVKFCKIGALSPDHSAPFDASANGFVMGEGCGILVLKRYEDAVRDGDRVYAVIRGIGASSDGKGKGITAPNIKGQLRALHRAYEAAGIDPWEVDLIEAHGTSTIVGDQVEVQALSEVIGTGRRDRPVRIGSVKSMIGHLKSAAGAASIIKAALAIHHGILPPSLGFKAARAEVPLDVVPLQVQTHTEPWPATENGLRRAGVSAFGFGGTNFHVVLESFTGQAMPTSRGAQPMHDQAASPVRPAPAPAAPATRATAAPRSEASTASEALPEGIWATSGANNDELIRNLELLLAGEPAPWDPSAPMRIAAAAKDDAERKDQISRSIAALAKGTNPDMLRARAIQLADGPTDGRLAMLFTGQGSQYANMGLDLAEVYPVVRETFEEADRVLASTLGRSVSDLIRLAPGEDRNAKEDLLRRTEYSQPATLTLDVAILRLLVAYGVAPDIVAGHSLGEYGAAVAAGIMTFEQALLATSARGREMAAIKLEDPGKMAGVATSTAAVEEVLAEVGGYVVAANKNCPSQTVIAGASDAVEQASERFLSRGITVYPLPVSHAFHTAIVEPACEPLRRVLSRLDLKPPKRPITTNVTADWYPTGPDAVPGIIDLLAQQVSSPVEWTAQIERMYDEGARIFVEAGPKRALTGFAVAILKRRPHLALYTNHPKRGGVWSFRDALAGLLVAGLPVRSQPSEGIPDLFAPVPPRRATSEAMQGWIRHNEPAEANDAPEAQPDIAQGVLRIVADTTGYDLEELDLDYELEADLGIDTVKQAEVFSTVRDTWSIPSDDSFNMSEHRTLRALIDWAASRVGATRPRRAAPQVPSASPPAPPAPAPVEATPPIDADVLQQFLKTAIQTDGTDADAFARAMLPAMRGLVQAAFDAARKAQPEPPPQIVQQVPVSRTVVVCSGASLGLPGGDAVFADDNVRRIFDGENRISHIGDYANTFLGLNLVRLVKDPQTGQGSFLPVEETDQVIRLAGRKAHFDLADYGVPDAMQRALDVTTQLGLAAAIEALRDAGIPLVRTYKTSASGKRVPQGWALPEPLRERTGVVFGSVFPGFDQLIKHVERNGDDGEGHFDRRFLFQVLNMGHAQIAQYLGAQGPNTGVNAACASTTQAISVAEDWIRVGRCDRVIVVGADDATNDTMLKWIGGGFMAAGAASTHDIVEETALPFDARRHGLVLGMGAVGLVMEREDACRERGITPIAELVTSSIVNSAFHGTRLHPTHVADEMQRMVRRAQQQTGVTPAQIASSAMFMSHETYTPARGGSAAAEIDALRQAFGEGANQIVITNTKGFTGHPMGAGIEDTVAVKGLQYGRVPPVANFKVPDEDLGELQISLGGARDVEYAIRLAAGFGSQLAISLWKRIARGDERVDDQLRAAWLRRVTGYRHVSEHVELRTLRVEESDVDLLLPLPTPFERPVPATALATAAPATAQAAAPAQSAAPAPAPAAHAGDVQGDLLAIISQKTGYGIEELELDFELEADLGIDTVKQAEIFSELRERYGMQRDDDFRLSDYPTIESLAAYVAGQVGATATERPTTTERPAAPVPPPAEAAPKPAALEKVAAPAKAAPTPVPVSREVSPAGGSLGDLLGVISEKTGYAVDELEPDFELEADLGIDTVKQAEIFSELRDRYQLERDDAFRLSDYPTIESLARWLDSQRGAQVDSLELVPTTSITAVPAPRRSEGWSRAALPPSFRLRRPILVDLGVSTERSLGGVNLRVLGDGSIADAIRAEVQRRGAGASDSPHVVIDAGVDVLESMQVAQQLDARRPLRWLTLTRLGGLGEAAPRARAYTDGARAGFCKSLGREWDTVARVIDVPPEDTAEEVAAALCEEVLCEDGVEVVRRNSRRQTVDYQTVPVPASAALPEGSVVLITGGARGICARIAQEIATRGPCKLALVGRSPAPAGALDLEAEKKRLRAELGAKHDRVTPAMLQKALAPLQKGQEVWENLENLRSLGAEVRYYAADLADPAAIAPLVQAVEKDLGSLDVVIHGAGVEESRLLADKDQTAFHRVFDGKARGGRALLDALGKGVFFVSMGSVAGRFGNAGQTDYAAANDAMARMCLARPRSLHLDWTAWDDVGMAVRGGMRRLLEDRGVDLLPADAGAGLLVDLIAAETEGELVVAGRLGDFLPKPPHPLLDTLEHVGDTVVATRTLSLDSDPWIADHAIEGVPVLPGVVGIELMTAAATAALPGFPPVALQHVRFAKPIKLHKGEPVLVTITATPQDGWAVRCEVFSERTLRTGRAQRTEHFAATVILGEVTPPEHLPSAFFPDERLGPADIYARFFHGPSFQVIAAVIGVARDGLLARGEANWDALGQGLRTPALAIEAAFQAAGLHRMLTEQKMALPSEIDEVRFTALPQPGDDLELMVHRGRTSYDIDVDGPAGAIVRLRGFRMVDLEALPPDKQFDGPESRPLCFPDSSATTPKAPVRTASAQGPRDDATARALAEGEEVSRWLSPSEVQELEGRGTKRRIQDRIAGRIAAKRALSRLTGARPGSIRIRTAESGEPIAEISDHPRARVSISHRDGRAVAIAVSQGRVGIDLERVEKRSKAFSQDWFVDHEQDLVHDDPERQTVVWSAKEAVLKALGKGMALSPRDVVVRSIGEGGADVELHGEAAEVHGSLGGGPFVIRWYRDEDDAFVVVTARLSA